MQIEKIDYNINWRNFKAGYSFFIPCIACTEAKKTLKETARKLKINIVMKTVIENNIRGIRVWRV
jgi:hypothetical protein